MSTFRTQAIVLDKRNIQEDSRVYILYTKDYGKIEAMARGSRKILSKLAPHLEPPILSNLMIARGKKLDKLAGAASHYSYSNIKSDFFKIEKIFSCFQVLDALTRLNQKDEKIWHLLEKYLEICENAVKFEFNEKGEILQNAFLIKLLAFLGYKPELEKCVLCRKENLAPPYFFDYVKGGLACKNCKEKFSIASMEIEQDILKEVKYLLKKKFEEILNDSSFKLKNKTKEVISSFVKIHIQ